MSKIHFYRGAAFAAKITIPTTFADGHFRHWWLQASLRVRGDTTRKGLIANLGAFWEDSTTTRAILLNYNRTDHFRLGDATLFIRLENPGVTSMMLDPVDVEIHPGMPI